MCVTRQRELFTTCYHFSSFYLLYIFLSFLYFFRNKKSHKRDNNAYICLKWHILWWSFRINILVSSLFWLFLYTHDKLSYYHHIVHNVTYGFELCWQISRKFNFEHAFIHVWNVWICWIGWSCLSLGIWCESIWIIVVDQFLMMLTTFIIK